MKVVVTGAGGFVGKHLTKRLAARGDEVIPLPRDFTTVPPADAVVHLAGAPISRRWNEKVKREIYASRIESTRKLIDAFAHARPGAFVCASEVGYYGNRGDEILTEASAPGVGFLAHTCIDWEREAARARTLGVRTVSLRFSLVLGRDGGALAAAAKPARFGLGAQFGEGAQWMPWIHIEDLVSMILFATTDTNWSEPVNACAGAVTNHDFTKALGRALHRPAFLTVPRFALRAALGEAACLLLDSQRVAAHDFPFAYPTLDAALTDLLGN